MIYPEAIKYLESFINYEKIPYYSYKDSVKLERIKDFLSLIGNPQESLRVIHVAGSKGKGSTSAFIAQILKEAGFKTGLYTSPHLSDFRERIRVFSCQPSAISLQPKEFEGMIEKKDLTRLVKKLRPKIEQYNRILKYGPLSFFEAYTALAFVYFKEKKVDFAVLETGMGGRLDATNTTNAQVCVITPISYEHTDKLGKTLRQIAREKAGIIKSEIRNPKSESAKPIVICAPQEKEALDVIRKRCIDVGAKIYEIKKNKLTQFKTQLLGFHQQINANVAKEAVKALSYFGAKISDSKIRKGLAGTFWPGRCEVISQKPFIVLDGAQNKASAKALKEAIRANFRYNKLILVLGISQDKDIRGICAQLRTLAGTVILTKSSNPRATEPKVLARYFPKKDTRQTSGVKEALCLAKEEAKEKDLILVTGSLFVVGEAREDILSY
ncbi:MAG: bifunctional folylpolyglutamate synthase/dihydrofolate synthase [Candidatus Omnitrophica bacterium]|jgi:dihydrofolate synthase/folylpolyglutamate synthase|nr:bifunctional folylpolyglutamate synthase/dihydrofolate synthase [Candidatus Omnitrophota bacterium]